MSSNSSPHSVSDYTSTVTLRRCVELFQGWYYVLVGLWVAISPTSFPLQSIWGPIYDLDHYWVFRATACLTAGVGVLFIIDRRNKPIVGTTGLGLGWPMIVGTLEVICVINGLLPAGYLLDLAMQVAFFSCWAYMTQLVWRGNRLSQNSGKAAGP